MLTTKIAFYVTYPIGLFVVTSTWLVMNGFFGRVTWLETYKEYKRMLEL